MFTCLAQAAISQRQPLFGSSSAVLALPKPCSLNVGSCLTRGSACLPASLTSGYAFPTSRLGWDCVTPGQMQICSCCCSWPAFQLDEFLGLTQRLTKTRRGIGGDRALEGRAGCSSSQRGMFSLTSSLGAVLMLLHGLQI